MWESLLKALKINPDEIRAQLNGAAQEYEVTKKGLFMQLGFLRERQARLEDKIDLLLKERGIEYTAPETKSLTETVQ